MVVEKYILLLMYFIAPAAHDKDDASRVWMLQSTTQTEFEKSANCFSVGQQIIAAVDPVNTMTVRAWCICPNPNDPVCKQQAEKYKTRNRTLVGPKVIQPKEFSGTSLLVPLGKPQS